MLHPSCVRKAHNFNPRSHERSDLLINYLLNTCLTFQSTLPREERLSACVLMAFCPNFNPRSHERSDGYSKTDISCITYFNPRSHERSDMDKSQGKMYYSISIHAPTRGATFLFTERMRRARLFQSTLPREERHSGVGSYSQSIISIHAPTRGATIYLTHPHFPSIFQSTLPREERRLCVTEKDSHMSFQSTLPREERHGKACRV